MACTFNNSIVIFLELCRSILCNMFFSRIRHNKVPLVDLVGCFWKNLYPYVVFLGCFFTNYVS